MTPLVLLAGASTSTKGASSMNLGSMFVAAAGYLRKHPEELIRVSRNALARRVGVPLDVVRWLAGGFRDGPRDLELVAVPPGVRASATRNLMGNRVRATAVVCVEGIQLGADAARLEVR